MEIWKDVKGQEGKYQVSSLGRVKSVKRYVKHNYGGTKIIYESILKTTLASRGYPAVSISGKTIQVHRLVAEAFLYNDDIKKEVNHKDGYKTNNCVENLEWVTRSQNRLHAFRLGLQKHTEQSRRKTSESLKGHSVSEETRDKIRKKNTGKHHTEETKKKLSDANKNGKSYFFGRHPWIYGLHHSEETKRKIGEANKGKICTLERKKKISEAKKKWWAEKKRLAALG